MRKFLRGPWRWIEGDMPHWAPPDGFAGLDLRTLPEQAAQGGTPGLGIFVGQGDPGSDYDLLGEGSWYDIKADKKLRDAIPGNYRPKGDDLIGLLFDVFTDGADPEGLDAPKPLMPTTAGRLELHFGQSHHERFRWGGRYTNNVQDLIRRDFAETMRDSLDGKMRDQLHHLRILDAICDKYGVEDWKEFVPPALQKDVPGRVKHETTITDDFDRADGDAIGHQLSWTESSGDWDTVSNQVSLDTAFGLSFARAQSDLSSADHYASVSIVANPTGGNNQIGSVARFDDSENTGYSATLVRFGSDFCYLYKFIAGSPTALSNPIVTVGLPDVAKTQCNGSTIEAYYDGVSVASVTDTSISSNVRCGLSGYKSGVSILVDDFEASDLAPSGLLYTQLERATRGINRGMYTQWG